MRSLYNSILLIGIAIFLTTYDTQKNKSRDSDFPILNRPYLGQSPPGTRTYNAYYC